MNKTAKNTPLDQEKHDPPAEEADGEREVLAAIAAMEEPYRAMGKRLHAIIKRTPRHSCRDSDTGCPRTPGTAKSSASSAEGRISRKGTGQLVSTTSRTSTKATCGRSRTLKGVDRGRGGKDRSTHEESGKRIQNFHKINEKVKE